MNMDSYFTQSLELHLFFARIMKEHALFLQTGFQMINKEQIRKAGWFYRQFEDLLREVVKTADGMVPGKFLESQEAVTDFTFFAERKTSQLTGVDIDSQITNHELKMKSDFCSRNVQKMHRKVRKINRMALQLLDGLIAFKEQLYREAIQCRIFTANYPLLIQHITREAKLYRSFVGKLEKNRQLCEEDIRETELFWNRIMMEHAFFIRGLLDPTEGELIDTADQFAGEYKRLLEEANKKNCETMKDMTGKSLELTRRYRDFKTEGTKGITECQIQSMILPLLADHVLREANHYLRLLEEQKGKTYGTM